MHANTKKNNHTHTHAHTHICNLHLYTFITQSIYKLGHLAILFGFWREIIGHWPQDGLERCKKRAGRGQGSGTEEMCVGSCF